MAAPRKLVANCTALNIPNRRNAEAPVLKESEHTTRNSSIPIAAEPASNTIPEMPMRELVTMEASKKPPTIRGKAIRYKTAILNCRAWNKMKTMITNAGISEAKRECSVSMVEVTMLLVRLYTVTNTAVRLRRGTRRFGGMEGAMVERCCRCARQQDRQMTMGKTTERTPILNSPKSIVKK